MCCACAANQSQTGLLVFAHSRFIGYGQPILVTAMVYGKSRTLGMLPRLSPPCAGQKNCRCFVKSLFRGVPRTAIAEKRPRITGKIDLAARTTRVVSGLSAFLLGNFSLVSQRPRALLALALLWPLSLGSRFISSLYNPPSALLVRTRHRAIVV